MEALIVKYIEEFRPRVYGYPHLKSRKSGSYRFFDLHVVFDPDMSIREAHDLGDALVARVKEHFPDAKMTIHAEACDGSCKQHCRHNCTVYSTKMQASS